MIKIFICHSSTDKPFVRRISNDLRGYGYEIWIDETQMNIGDSLVKKIQKALDKVDFVVVVLSKSALKSEWVKRELDIAVNREIREKKVIILPIIIEQIKLPRFLSGRLYGDFSKKNRYNKQLQLLLRSLNSRIKKR